MKKQPKQEGVVATQEQIDKMKQHLVAQQFDSKFQDALEKEVFPNLTESWIGAAITAIRFASPIGMGVSCWAMKEMIDALTVCDAPITLNCYQVALLNNNIEARSMNDLGLCTEGYTTLMAEAMEVQKRWNANTQEIRLRVIAEIESQIKIKPAGPGQRQPMSVVTGQA